MKSRNLNLPISNDHGLTAAQTAEFCAWVAAHPDIHPDKGTLSHKQEAWAVAECIDNCFDVPTEEALACAMSTFSSVLFNFEADNRVTRILGLEYWEECDE
mgnify:CR=1 FL=1